MTSVMSARDAFKLAQALKPKGSQPAGTTIFSTFNYITTLSPHSIKELTKVKKYT